MNLPRSPLQWSSPTAAAVVAVLYYAAARVGLLLAFEGSNASPVWPPSGLALAAVLLLGTRVWPGVFFGAFAANFAVFAGNQTASLASLGAVSGAIALGNTLEALAGAWLFRRWLGAGNALNDGAAVMRFVGVAVLMCVASAGIGSVSLLAGGVIPSAIWGTVAVTWWTGDIAGVLILTPALLGLGGGAAAPEDPRRRRESAGLLLVLVLVAAIPFGGWLPRGLDQALMFLLFPAFLWPVFRLSQRAAAAAVVCVSLLAILQTVRAVGPFARDSLNESLLLLQGFVCVIAITIHALAAALAERRRVAAALQRANADLTRRSDELLTLTRTQDQLVAERTSELETLYRTSPVGLAQLDRDLRFVRINETLARFHGLTVATELGRTLREAVPQLADQVEPLLRQMFATGQAGTTREVRIHMTSTPGGEHWYLPSYHPQHDATGRVVAVNAVVVDITERKQAEEALRASESRFRTLFENAPYCIHEIDREGRLLLMNRAGLTMMGVQEERAICGMPYLAAVAGEDQERIDRLLRLALGGQASEFEFQATNGHTFQSCFVPVTDAPGAVVRLMGMTLDITARKQAEEALQLFRALVERSSDSIEVIDPATGRFLDMNERGCLDLGYAREEVLQLSVPDIDPKVDGATFQQVVGKLREAGAMQFESLHRRKDGTQFPVEVALRLVSLNREYLVASVRDITERQRLEQVLVWEKHALEVLASSASLAEVLHELVLGLERLAPGALCSILRLDDDGIHLRHGAAPSLPEACNALIDGVAIGPAVGSCGTAAHANRQVIVTDIATDPLWANYHDLALAHGLRACWSTPIRSTAGKVLGTFATYYREPRQPTPAELELISRAQHLVGLAVERKQAEEALEKMRFSVDHAGDSIFWISREGHILYVNDAACTSRGYSRAELLGMKIFDLDPDYQPGIWGPHFEELKRRGTLTLETRHRAKDGRVFPVEVNANYVHLGGQEFNFAALRDITVRKRIEAKQFQLSADLQRSNAELEQFAYVASHDLQEPLRAVAGCVQILRSRYAGKLDARADELIRHSVEGAERMQGLIGDLLAFSRVGTDGAKPVPLESATALATALANLRTALVESGATVTHDPLPPVLGDLTQLTQLFQNLVGNALKYRSPRPPAIHVSAVREGEQWRFAVRDNGIGIEPQYFERIFVIFQRLHTRVEYPGTGIGLALCKKIVERHGGRIWLESQPGEGSIFYFTLPAQA